MAPKKEKLIRKESRPWGKYEVLLTQPGVKVKRIEIRPGLRFSLQKHRHRTEKWIVISGTGVAVRGKNSVLIKPGSFLDIPKGMVHRLYNSGSKPLVLIEIQFGSYLGEDDIVRLEDDFKRC